MTVFLVYVSNDIFSAPHLTQWFLHHGSLGIVWKAVLIENQQRTFGDICWTGECRPERSYAIFPLTGATEMVDG